MKAKIAVLAGDGVGREIVPEAVKVLKAVAEKFEHTFEFLSALEAAIPRHVSIKSIRLDPGSAVVHITGLAVTVEDVTALTVTLQDHAVFRDPVLGQHRVGPDGLVEFDLTLRYRQPGV